MDGKYHFMFIVIILGLILFVGYFFYSNLPTKNIFGEKICGDGTVYDKCSLRKPYYCSDGLLFERASVCGCPEGFNQSGELCPSEYQKNPQEIEFKYILRGNEKSLKYTLYGGMIDYLSVLPKSITYDEGDESSRVDFKLKAVEEQQQKKLLEPLVVEIQNLVDDEQEQIRIATSIVQNIEWGWSNKTINFGGFKLNYSRYPYEVLSDSQGICGEKSELLAFLLKEMGYGVVIFYNQFENHESVGVRCSVEESWKGTGYCFIETSGPAIMTDSSIEYIGGLTLDSEPQVLLISHGKSLGDDFYEYKDADDLMKIKDNLRFDGINLFEQFKFRKLKEKYGLVETYNLD